MKSLIITSPCSIICISITLFASTLIGVVRSAGVDSYENIKYLHDSRLNPAAYSTSIRPIQRQYGGIRVFISFSLVAIVSLDDVKQQLVTNGFLIMHWKDERAWWNPEDFGRVYQISPNPKDIWRPRMLLINTLSESDVFKDDASHTTLRSNGVVQWVPGGLFETYCKLDMDKFPFDVQHCYIQLCPSSYRNNSLMFAVTNSTMDMAFFFPNPGWTVVKGTTTTKNVDVGDNAYFSCIMLNFELKRRPATAILNIILPVILISILNNFVFLIPAESGEKISYAVTVLLAQAVFLTIVSAMTPQLTDTVPALAIYLSVLLTTSVVTVCAAIFTVYLHHKDEEEATCLQCQETLKNGDKIFSTNQPMFPEDSTTAEKNHENGLVSCVTKSRKISMHINIIFFVIVKIFWFVVTIWFFTYTSS